LAAWYRSNSARCSRSHAIGGDLLRAQLVLAQTFIGGRQPRAGKLQRALQHRALPQRFPHLLADLLPAQLVLELRAGQIRLRRRPEHPPLRQGCSTYAGRV
jgi:hypothetical protein